MAPYLSLLTQDAPQREQSLRDVCNGLRWIVRARASWRMLPHDLPPWEAGYQQMRRWGKAGVFGPSGRIYGRWCGSPRGETPSRRRPSWTVARDSRVPRVDSGRALMGPSASGAAKGRLLAIR
jgi:hypothetical protein